MYIKIIKRLLDILFASAGLLVLCPLLGLIIIILAIHNNGKPFFYQQRPGKHEKLFTIIKFKTMNDKTDKQGNLLPPNKRITKIGNFIRKSSIDEIPQLINVLIGDMSLVGPRPLLPEYLSLYTHEQKKRHSVKPGITGLAQVSGRNAISWKEKFTYDVFYTENVSFLLDIKIVFMTCSKVLKKAGINNSDQLPMPKFNGRN